MATNALATMKLLVVSGDSSVLRPIWSIGESNCWQLEIAANAWEAMDKVQSGATLDLLLLDVPQGNGDGLHTLRWMRRLRPGLPIIMIGHDDDGSRRQESIRLGASDYLYKPIEERHLELAIQHNLSMAPNSTELEFTSDDLESIGNGRYFISLSPVMRKLRTQAAMLAETDTPVLIVGEDGSGKETTARLLHSLSLRSGFEFMTVKCAALPEDLLERELFGYERKDAAGSVRTRKGKVETCAEGTILLEDIAEMPFRLQASLLEVIENKRFVRPGTSAVVEADVRVLATNSAGNERAAFESRLDKGLYQCLTAYSIHIPPLRDRREEIPLLGRHLMHRFARQYGLPARDLSPEILDVWKKYAWPGNLPELEHYVKRYLMVGDKELALDLNRSDVTADIHNIALDRPRNSHPSTHMHLASSDTATRSRSLRSLIQSVKSEAEKNAIAVALEKTGWNRKAAARLLRVSYRTVLYKIEQYKMTAPNFSMPATNNGTLNRVANSTENTNRS